MPLLSIIIPTHNRARYAIATIRSALSIGQDIEVVVADSSPVDMITSEFPDDLFNARLKISRSEKPMSVVDNFNHALSAASGDFLVFIGDDDFVSAEIVPLARWARDNSVDAVKLNFPALYYWPDFVHATRGDMYSGTLHISAFSGKIAPHDAKEALRYALTNFGGGVFEMPRAYAGMLSAKLARNIVSKYGALFGGVSPDIYSSALIACESAKCVAVDFPVIIPGASGQSTAGQSAAGGHRGKLRDNDHIAAFKDLVWDKRIPEFYSVPTVWSFSLLKAVETIKGTGGGAGLSPNFGRVILKCFAYHRDQVAYTQASLRHLFQEYGYARMAGQLASALFAEGAWAFGRVKSRLRGRYIKDSVQVLSNLESTFEARERLESFLSNHENRLEL